MAIQSVSVTDAVLYLIMSVKQGILWEYFPYYVCPSVSPSYFFVPAPFSNQIEHTRIIDYAKKLLGAKNLKMLNHTMTNPDKRIWLASPYSALILNTCIYGQLLFLFFALNIIYLLTSEIQNKRDSKNDSLGKVLSLIVFICWYLHPWKQPFA